jgi:hypothetical protein
LQEKADTRRTDIQLRSTNFSRGSIKHTCALDVTLPCIHSL